MSGRGRLGKGLLGGEALGIGAGAGEGAARRLGALHLCEDALFKTLAETVEGRLDALDIAEVGTKAEDHDGPDGSSLRGAAGDAAISGHRPCVRPMAGDCCVSLAMTKIGSAACRESVCQYV